MWIGSREWRTSSRSPPYPTTNPHSQFPRTHCPCPPQSTTAHRSKTAHASSESIPPRIDTSHHHTSHHLHNPHRGTPLRSEKAVRLPQKIQVGPCISVGTQLNKAEVGPTSGPTWRLSHSKAFTPFRRRSVYCISDYPYKIVLYYAASEL